MIQHLCMLPNTESTINGQRKRKWYTFHKSFEQFLVIFYVCDKYVTNGLVVLLLAIIIAIFIINDIFIIGGLCISSRCPPASGELFAILALSIAT